MYVCNGTLVAFLLSRVGEEVDILEDDDNDLIEEEMKSQTENGTRKRIGSDSQIENVTRKHFVENITRKQGCDYQHESSLVVRLGVRVGAVGYVWS